MVSKFFALVRPRSRGLREALGGPGPRRPSRGPGSNRALLSGRVELKGASVPGHTKPYEFIGFGAMEVTKPSEFIGFGAINKGHQTL